MAPCYRVQKRRIETGQGRKRGRPKKYSESWTKRLVLLRMCGLNLNDIVRVLEIQGGDAFAAKDRRPQQLVRQLLSDGNHRFSPPDRQTARKRAAFIRATIRYDGRDKPQRPAPTPSSHESLFQNDSQGTAYTGSPTDIVPRLSCSSSGAYGGSWPLHVPVQSPSGSTAFSEASQEQQRSSEFRFFRSSFSVSPSKGNAQSPLLDRLVPEVPSTQDTTSPDWSIDDPHNRDSTVLIPSKRHRMRETIKHASFSSSFVSDLLSLMEKRFSLSTFATSSRLSVSAASLAETEMSFSEGKAAEVLGQSQQTAIRANAALTQECCSKTAGCGHQYIARLIDADPYLVHMPPGGLESRLRAAPVVQLPSDSYGNTELFFAARVGAPSDVILSLIQVTADVNTVNADGQTFLYFLSTNLFSGRYCSCSGRRAHASKFECVVRSLECRNYDFDHLDNHGRSFLSFLCATATFDMHWLSDIMLRDNEWQQRVWRLAQLRDATGVFLIDFMALSPGFDVLSEDIRSQFRPLFVHNPTQVDQSGILSDEDEQGRTRLHQYIQKDFLQTAALHEVSLPFDIIGPDINRYNVRGRTPLMDFLLQAFEQEIEESVICAKVQHLLRCGANVNARSRGGSTILHFAAKKALPKLLETLLTTDIQVDHGDNAGYSALDYAAKVFNRSRTFKAPAALTARSLKSTAHLLGVVSHTFRRDRAIPASAPTKDIKDRALQTLQQLVSPHGQRYPPSLSSGVWRSKGIFELCDRQS